MALALVEKGMAAASTVCPVVKLCLIPVSAARKLLGCEGSDGPDADLKKIQRELEEISRQNQELMRQISSAENKISYGEYMEKIKYQYDVLMEVLEAGSGQNMTKFRQVYESTSRHESLLTLYNGVKGTELTFLKPLLPGYQKQCNFKYDVMERYCSDLLQLFCMGFITVMVYTAIDNDDFEYAQKKWSGHMEEVVEEMRKALDECQKN